MVHRIQGTVSSIDNGTVAIQFEDGQVLTLPLRDLQPRPQVGESYTMTILPEAEARQNNDELARTILSQLITDVPPASQNAEGKGAQDSA